MWEAKSSNIGAGVVSYQIEEEGSLLSFESWAKLLASSQDFASFFSGILQESRFDAFFWEVKAVHAAIAQQFFEFVLVESSTLARIHADSSAFDEHFSASKEIVSFPSLGGDAYLIAPAPIGDRATYAHLASFLRGAPQQQVIALWKSVGKIYLERIAQAPIWLSTSGLGVPWLHVRIDSTPKYYQHNPYK